jgi:hypothetical protein
MVPFEFPQKMMPQGLKQASEKVQTKSERGGGWISRAKARVVLLTLSARLKPCPCYKARSVEIFSKLKSQLILMVSSASFDSAQGRL